MERAGNLMTVFLLPSPFFLAQMELHNNGKQVRLHRHREAQAGTPLVSLLQLVCERLPFMLIVKTKINGYLKVQLRCFVANLNIDEDTRFMC